MNFFILLSFLFGEIWACSIGSFEQVALIKSEKISEASGMDFSRQHRNVFWTHNDSGDAPVLFAVGTDGKKIAQFSIETPVNDWEDLSVGKCLSQPGDCIYISDTGNKKGQRSSLQILEIVEPKILTDHSLPVNRTLTFKSSGQNFESLALDENRNVFYLLNKKGRRFDPIDSDKGLITLFSLNPTNSVLSELAHFDFTQVTGLNPQDTLVTAADFNASTDTLLIGTYGKAFEIAARDFLAFPKGLSTHVLPVMEKAEAFAYLGTEIWATSEGKNPPLERFTCR